MASHEPAALNQHRADDQSPSCHDRPENCVYLAVPSAMVESRVRAYEDGWSLDAATAGTVFLTTDDCRATYEELKSRGVEFVEEPEERPYGIDAGFRDPSGNHIRLTEVREMSGV